VRGRCRLLAIDADGTLLDERKRVTARSRAALAELHRRGTTILLTTGRRYRTALPIVAKTGLPLTVAAHNGVLIRRSADDSTVLRRTMAGSDMVDVVRFLRADEIHPVVFVDRYAEGIDFVHDVEHPDDPYWRDVWDRNRDHFLRTDDLSEVSAGVLVVAAWGTVERLLEMEARFAAAFGDRLTHHVVTNVHYLGAVFEAYSPEAGKGAALRAFRERLGVPAEEVCAIGDDVNDLSMLEEAGLSIAMGNAVESVLAAADRVTGSNEEEGLAEALERWIL
jgi:HAD superfamily hydrolase (TIGR01484 family)